MALAVTLTAGPAQAAVEAAVDREVVAEGESLELTIRASGDAAEGAPQLAALEADFEVLGTSESRQVSIVNGRISSTRSWVITLVPRRRGELTVPAIKVGGETTRPLAIEVTAAPAPGEGNGPDVFVEVLVEPESPYVQAQVDYRVRIYYQQLSEGQLADPEVPGAIVRRHKEDLRYDLTRDGRRYGVLERRYVIFPQTSGPLEIPPPVFVGRVRDDSAGPRTPFGGFGAFDQLFQSARTVRRQGRAVTLEVRPRPADFQGEDWLPAEVLTLEQEWSGAEVSKVGEPITRTLVIRARGLEAAQLPELEPPAGPRLRAYADPPQLETTVHDGDAVAERRESHAIIPTAGGILRVPAVEVRWWSTIDDAPRTARLPGRTIHVLPTVTVGPGPDPLASPRGAAPRQSPPQESPLRQPAPPQPAPPPAGEPAAPEFAGSASAAVPARGAGVWPWLSAVLLAAWLVTLFLLLRRRREPGAAGGRQARGGSPSSSPAALGAVRRACAERDPAALRRALLAWGRARWPDDPPLSLPALARRLDDAAVAADLAAVDRALYGAGGSPPPELWQRLPAALAAARPVSQAAGADVPLPELYPRA